MKSMRNRLAAGLLLLPLGAGLAACDNDTLTEINENPNGPTNVEARYLLPAAIQGAVDEILGTGLDLSVTTVWVQHLARNEYGSVDRYELESTFSDSYWSDLWVGPLTDIQQLIDRAQAQEQANPEAVGRILKSWIFHNMTDLWGDIPYSEALTGGLADGTTTPKYDAQSEIYPALIEELTAAAAKLEPGAGGLGQSDLIYRGDVARWEKFANSLRLRLAMRLSEVDPAAARAGVQAALAAGVLESAADEARLDYPGAAPNENPLGPAFRNRAGYYRVSKAVVDTLAALADPRLRIYADPAEASGKYIGLPNGMTDAHGYGFTETSKLGAWFLRGSTPAVLQSDAEVLFLRAEAAARGWTAENAAELYHAAITASMRTYAIPEAEIAAYLAQPRVAHDAARGREQIALQKWIALFDQGPEAYAEWRRTGMPDLQAGPDNVNEGRIPVRFPYPTTEQSLNRNSLQAAMEKQAGAGINSPLWWDR